MMRMLEEMTGFDFFWHHHVSNFRGATLDNGEENNYCSSLTSNQNTSVQLFHARRSFKLSESGGLKNQKDNQHDFKNCKYVSSF